MVKYALYPGPRPYILTSLTLSPTDLMCGLLFGSPVACSRSAAVKSSIWAQDHPIALHTPRVLHAPFEFPKHYHRDGAILQGQLGFETFARDIAYMQVSVSSIVFNRTAPSPRAATGRAGASQSPPRSLPRPWGLARSSRPSPCTAG